MRGWVEKLDDAACSFSDDFASDYYDRAEWSFPWSLSALREMPIARCRNSRSLPLSDVINCAASLG
jgi:hypothetical protein